MSAYPVSGPWALKAVITDAYASSSAQYKEASFLKVRVDKFVTVGLPRRRRVLRAPATASDGSMPILLPLIARRRRDHFPTKAPSIFRSCWCAPFRIVNIRMEYAHAQWCHTDTANGWPPPCWTVPLYGVNIPRFCESMYAVTNGQSGRLSPRKH